MKAEPQTPKELKELLLSASEDLDEISVKAIDDLIEKIILTYCGDYELTPIEFCFARNLFKQCF